jgi:hypothetical protein
VFQPLRSPLNKSQFVNILERLVTVEGIAAGTEVNFMHSAKVEAKDDMAVPRPHVVGSEVTTVVKIPSPPFIVKFVMDVRGVTLLISITTVVPPATEVEGKDAPMSVAVPCGTPLTL